MDHTHRFDGKSEIYEKIRPQYADGLFAYFRDTLKIPADSVFADVGAGTGIFTRQLLSCGYTVFAVEPNRDMREKAEKALCDNARFRSVCGTATDTTLAERSVDFVTAAQAFHWFPPEEFRRECRRILRPGGMVMLVYNFRDKNADCTKALAEVYGTFNPTFHGYSNGISDEKCRAFFDGACTVYRADNRQVYDRQGYIDRALSSSYSLKEGDEHFAAYVQALGEIFDRYAVAGHITVPTDTVAYIGKV